MDSWYTDAAGSWETVRGTQVPFVLGQLVVCYGLGILHGLIQLPWKECLWFTVYPNAKDAPSQAKYVKIWPTWTWTLTDDFTYRDCTTFFQSSKRGLRWNCPTPGQQFFAPPAQLRGLGKLVKDFAKRKRQSDVLCNILNISLFAIKCHTTFWLKMKSKKQKEQTDNFRYERKQRRKKWT